MELAIYIYDALSQEQWQTSNLTDVCPKPVTHSPSLHTSDSDQSRDKSIADRPISDRQLHHSVGQLLHPENVNLGQPAQSDGIAVVWDGLMWFDGIVNLPLNVHRGANVNQPVDKSDKALINHLPQIRYISKFLTNQSLTSQSIRHWLIRLWLALPLALLSQVTLSLWDVPPSHSYTNQNPAPYAFCEPIYLCRTNHVLAAQQLLAQKGYYHAALDGIYGEATWSATRQFQQEYRRGDGTRLIVDGIAGPLTMAALHNLSPTSGPQNLTNLEPSLTEPVPDVPAQLTPDKSKVNPQPSAPNPLPINPDQDPVALAPAAEDDSKPPVNIMPAQREVRFMQALLQQAGFYNGAVNGIYDAATHDAIIQAQKDLGQVLTGEWNEQLATVLKEQVNPRPG